jgi:hypothetical protein
MQRFSLGPWERVDERKHLEECRSRFGLAVWDPGPFKDPGPTKIPEIQSCSITPHRLLGIEKLLIITLTKPIIRLHAGVLEHSYKSINQVD